MDTIGVIGLGYVGLPLAVTFGEKRKVIGFDINASRIAELKKGIDNTNEIGPEDFSKATYLKFTNDITALIKVKIFIVTVPTPIDDFKKPDLRPLKEASKSIGKILKKGDTVIYESTVYPGCTEEICIPILEEVSKLKRNIDFYYGYSPERINPGDKCHRLSDIIKVTSGSTPEIAEKIDGLYKSIITAGTHKTSSVKVAEAAKVIENAQRDLNIAFVNELSLIFDKMNIDTHEVLEAASTKWNFLPFKPGLVGGHCIGVDPYYLTYKAESLGYHPEVILSGRRINDNMGVYVAHKIIKLLSQRGNKIKGAKVLLMGITFKENCPDIRNSKVVDVYRELNEFGVILDVFDPWANTNEVEKEYDINLSEKPSKNYRCVIVAVPHEEFKLVNYRSLISEDGFVFDMKGFLKKSLVDYRL